MPVSNNKTILRNRRRRSLPSSLKTETPKPKNSPLRQCLSIKRTLNACKCTKTILKPCCQHRHVIIAEKKRNNDKQPLIVNPTLKPFQLKRQKPKPVSASRSSTQVPGKDKKLASNPYVLISSECRRKAEIVAMRLRKGSKLAEDIGKQSSSDNDESDERTTEDEDSSPSEVEESDDEDAFDKVKSYPLRKKVGLGLAPVVKSRSPQESVTKRVSSSSESSTESLLDLDFPVDRKWALAAKEKAASETKPSASLPYGSDVKRSQIQEPMKKPPPSLPKRSNDRRSSTSTIKEGIRTLRSSDTHPSGVPLLLRSGSVSNIKSFKSSKLTTPRSPQRSPERHRVEKSQQISQEKSDAEKSYSLRKSSGVGVEKKSATPEVSIKPKKIVTTTVVDGQIVPRRPGRPRKILPSTNPNEPGPSLRKESLPGPSSRGSLRHSRSTSKEYTSAGESQSGMQMVFEKKELRQTFPNPSKQLRDAIALRARQSKIIAKKSRGWQSKKFSPVWRKPTANRRNSKQGQEPSQNLITLSSNNLPVAESDQLPGRCYEIVTKDSSLSSNVVPISTNSGVIPVVKPRADPVANCDICNMTFTRRFSLTKHFLTIQHQKMVKKCGLSEHEANRSSTMRDALLLRYNKGSFTTQVQRKESGSEPHKTFPEKKLQVLKPVPEEKDVTVTVAAYKQNNERAAYQEHDEDQDSSSECESSSDNENDGRFNDNNGPSELDDRSGASRDSEFRKQEVWISGKAIGKNHYVCEVCGDHFTKKFDFSAHIWNHRDNTDLVCPDCGYKFANSEDYNQHIDSAHLVDTKLSCKYCPSKFNREDYLEKHMMSHRRDVDENFICSVCSKRFAEHDLLMRHFDIKHLALGKPRVELSCDSARFNRQCPPAFMENDGHNYYENYNGENDYMDEEMPDIDLELDENDVSQLAIAEGNITIEASIPMIISADDYNREIPVEICHPYAMNNLISQSGTSQPRLQKKPVGRKRIAIDDNTRIGCGMKNQRLNHIPVYSSNPLACKDCGKTFNEKKLLVKHVEYFNHTERFYCTICKKKFKWRYLLNRHMVRHQKEKKKPKMSKMKKSVLLQRRVKPSSKKLPKLLPILPKAKEHQPQNFLLNVATSSSLSGESNYSSPKKSSLPSTSAIKMSPASSATLYSSQLANSTSIPRKKVAGVKNKDVGLGMGSNSKFFTCEICAKSFTERSTLSVHTWFHQSETLFRCPDCDARCERKSDLELHFKCHETSQPFFLCYVCFKPFRWKKDMIRHVRKKHPEEKTYRCIYCHDRFRINDELTVHIAETHSEHRSYPCECCGRRYAQRRYLAIHIQTQHGIAAPATEFETSHEGSFDGEEQEFDVSSFLATDHQM